jgi:chaperonin GroEL (HSP60 family)
MSNKEIIDNFGEIIMSNVVDPVFNLYDHDLKRSAKKETTEEEMQLLMSKLSQDDLEVIKKIVLSAIKTTTHYFLWQAEQKNLDIFFKDMNIAELSDGLTGELYLDDGWFARFSKV